MKREQAIVREIASMISFIACCHSTKVCAHAARDFRSQQCLCTIDLDVTRFKVLCPSKSYLAGRLNLRKEPEHHLVSRMYHHAIKCFGAMFQNNKKLTFLPQNTSLYKKN